VCGGVRLGEPDPRGARAGLAALLRRGRAHCRPDMQGMHPRSGGWQACLQTLQASKRPRLSGCPLSRPGACTPSRRCQAHGCGTRPHPLQHGRRDTPVPAFWMRVVSVVRSLSLNDVDGVVCVRAGTGQQRHPYVGAGHEAAGQDALVDSAAVCAGCAGGPAPQHHAGGCSRPAAPPPPRRGCACRTTGACWSTLLCCACSLTHGCCLPPPFCTAPGPSPSGGHALTWLSRGRMVIPAWPPMTGTSTSLRSKPLASATNVLALPGFHGQGFQRRHTGHKGRQHPGALRHSLDAASWRCAAAPACSPGLRVCCMACRHQCCCGGFMVTAPIS
jgi:hypothetical protein